MEWKMPDLGEGVQEGEIVKWLVKEGDSVALDQHLVEIMTDKATMEIPSSVEGALKKILVKEGDVGKVGQTLALIEGAAASKEQIKKEKPAPVKPVPQKPVAVERILPERKTGAKPLAAPTVRRLAMEQGIDLSAIRGTGPGGRILTEDLQAGAKVGALRFVSAGPEVRKPLRGLRRKIADHMVLSRKTAAHFTHFDEADLTELVQLRDQAKKEAQAKGVKLTYLPYIIKAVVEGLKKYPQMNASLDEATQEVVYKKYFNIGVAVATPDGLIVPVVKEADKKNLYELARETARLGDAARNHKIALEDLKGGCFTITNIGSIGGMLSAPIINYPEVAIMGLHQIKPRPVVKDGKIAVGQIMYISVSADHRVVDGAEAAAFLKEVIQILEHPREKLL